MDSGEFNDADKKDSEEYRDAAKTLENRSIKSLTLPHDFGDRLSEN